MLLLNFWLLCRACDGDKHNTNRNVTVAGIVFTFAFIRITAVFGVNKSLDKAKQTHLTFYVYVSQGYRFVIFR